MRFHFLLIITAVVLLLAGCGTPTATPSTKSTAVVPTVAAATVAKSTVVAPTTIPAAAPTVITAATPTTASSADPCTTTAKAYQPGMLPTGRIAFQCFEDAKTVNLYVFDTTTGNITNLTHDTSTNTDIQWSPDGQQLTFYSNRAAHPGTYLLKTDGSQAKWLFDGSVARWSPDGKRLAFAREDGLYVMMASEQQPTRLSAHLGPVKQKAWSPDSGRLAFAAGPTGIHTIRIDGTQEKTLTDYSADFGDIAWSPDGAYLYFLSAQNGPLELYRVDANGGQPTRLATAPQDIDFFTVSPDGKKIVFRDDGGKVYAMNSDGSQSRQLLDIPTNHLSWSPDSQYLSFAYDEVAAVKVDTGQIITLTDSTATMDYPEWSPK